MEENLPQERRPYFVDGSHGLYFSRSSKSKSNSGGLVSLSEGFL